MVDFPISPLTQADTLMDILTHMSYLTGVNYHVLNSAIPMQSSAVLPLHPPRFLSTHPHYERRGIRPSLLAESECFVKPDYSASWLYQACALHSQRDLQEIFANSTFLAPATAAAKDAATVLGISLVAISDEISGRTFDEEGLAQGMPFLWRNLDPMRIPFFLSV